MDSPVSSPAQRGILVVAALLVFLFLSFFSIRNAIADHESELQTRAGYERAARLEPNDFRNWYLLGRYWQYNLEEGDNARAIREYLRAVALNPRDADVWSDLATSYEADGDLPAARDAYVHAKRAYPLSAEVSWRYANFLLRQGELDAAFAQMRQAVEADPLRGAEALSRSLRAEPDFDRVFERVLPRNGAAYLAAMHDQTNEGYTDNALKIWNRLLSLQPRLTLWDGFPLVSALRRERKFADARQVWEQAVNLSGLSTVEQPAGSLLWDGGFESGFLGGNYGWAQPANVPGAQISIDPHQRHSGVHSLQLFFSGKFNSNLNGPCHDVPVEPSTAYRFSGWLRTQSLTTDQGIRFQLRSLGRTDSPLTVIGNVVGTQPWTLFETPWNSGADTHEMQVCIVRYTSREADDKIQGIAWVDDVALIPSSREPARP